MKARLLILRPEPGGSETAARAEKLGFKPLRASLFNLRALPWEVPDPAGFDAVMLTSANAVRFGGNGLASFLHLPCHAVGEATARAAQEIGFAHVIAGPSDAQALADQAPSEWRRVFRPTGRDHIPIEAAPFEIVQTPVYAAEAIGALPAAAVNALVTGALVLIHSPRAGSVFVRLLDQSGLERDRVSLAAISKAAAASAGDGWKSVAVAARPTDEALLELAAKLCQTEA